MGNTRPYTNGALTATVVDVSTRCEGILKGLQAYNPNTSDVWVQVFKVAAASVTLGTTTPVLSFLVPKGDGTNRGAYVDDFVAGISLGGVAVSVAATTTRAGSTAPSTAIEVNMQYL